MAQEAPRALAQRLSDTRRLLASEVDTWVATADANGVPHLVPLSFLWDGSVFTVSTPHDAPTARNLRANGRVRLSFGHTRDVVLVRGSATGRPAEDVDQATADALAEKTAFDPRRLQTRYDYFTIRPELVQAWREVPELAGRTLMRGGEWLG